MAWWLEGAIFRHFGWVRNPSEAIFSYFWSQEKNQKKIFPGNIGFYRGKIEFYRKNRRFSPIFFSRFFHPNIFSSTIEIRFFSEKSAEIGDFFVHGLTTLFHSTSTHIVKLKPSSNITCWETSWTHRCGNFDAYPTIIPSNKISSSSPQIRISLSFIVFRHMPYITHYLLGSHHTISFDIYPQG